MSQDWDIKPRSRECQGCHSEFQDLQEYFTRLVFAEQGYERADYCAGCWAAQVAAGHYSAWKGVFRLPPPEPDRTVRKETAESLLRDKVAENNRTGAVNPAVLYILAVMLERQRVLVEREIKTGDDGRRHVVYEHRKTGESFVVLDPQLKLTDLEQVQVEVMALLAPGVAKPGSVPAPVAGEPVPAAEPVPVAPAETGTGAPC